MSKALSWYEVIEAGEIASPALLIYPQRVKENILSMIRMAGSADRLRPHVKTHKMSAIVKLCRKHGIEKFKCATLGELEMVAGCGAKDIMLAMQPVGPILQKIPELQRKYPASRISVILDNYKTLISLSLTGHPVGVWVDINNGMGRTGVVPEKAFEIYRKIFETDNLEARGLHVYDGHIHDIDPEMRKKSVEADFDPVIRLIKQIRNAGLEIPAIDAGGTPTFPIHAGHEDTELSPGTTFLWDAGYSERYPDMEFKHAAVLLTRVVSKPDDDLVCLDLGHKAIAAEMPHPRVRLLNTPPHEFVNHSEEHLVLKTDHASGYQVGDTVYGIPWHVCPTVARYPFAYLILDNRLTGTWEIDARDRTTSIS